MTICAQGLDPATELDHFNELLENMEFVAKLGPLVQNAIENSISIPDLRGKILDETRGLMAMPEFARRES